jgi:hypothetical protein
MAAYGSRSQFSKGLLVADFPRSRMSAPPRYRRTTEILFPIADLVQ